jgi:hypothetical protein
MNISDEAVEAAARVAYAAKPAKYYLDDSVVTWEQLGDSRSGQLRKDQELSKMRELLEAAAPHLMAQAWLEGRNSQTDKFAANPYWKEAK